LEGLIVTLVAFLYWLLPDLMFGNPIDDIIVSLIAALSRFKRVSGRII